MSEVWLPIAGYEEAYEISSFGRVRSLPREVLCGYGKMRRLTPRIKKAHLNRSGYCSILLWQEGKPTTFLVHRLVAQAFIPNPTNKPQVNHKDTNKANNASSNLEWTTAQENFAHAEANKLTTAFRKASFDKNSIRVIATNSITGHSVQFKSMREAERAGFVRVCISRVLSGATPLHKNHYWRLDEDTST